MFKKLICADIYIDPSSYEFQRGTQKSSAEHSINEEDFLLSEDEDMMMGKDGKSSDPMCDLFLSQNKDSKVNFKKLFGNEEEYKTESPTNSNMINTTSTFGKNLNSKKALFHSTAAECLFSGIFSIEDFEKCRKGRD
jgi:hypothetical protein